MKSLGRAFLWDKCLAEDCDGDFGRGRLNGPRKKYVGNRSDASCTAGQTHDYGDDRVSVTNFQPIARIPAINVRSRNGLVSAPAKWFRRPSLGPRCFSAPAVGVV